MLITRIVAPAAGVGDLGSKEASVGQIRISESAAPVVAIPIRRITNASNTIRPAAKRQIKSQDASDEADADGNPVKRAGAAQVLR